MDCEYIANSQAAGGENVQFTFGKGFRFIRRLGSGTFGIVNEAQRVSDEKKFAVKRTTLPESLSKQEKVFREVSALKKLNHPNIVKYYNHWTESSSDEDTSSPEAWKKSDDKESEKSDSGSSGHNFRKGYSRDDTRLLSSLRGCLEDFQDLENFHLQTTKRAESKSHNDHSIQKSPKKKLSKPDENYLFIQMELCNQMNLKEWLEENPRRSKNDMNVFLFQITSALEHVHNQFLMHRDLKPANIFFSLDGVLKIGDFGLVKQFSPPPYTLESISQDSNYYHSPGVGTKLYQSHEQLKKLSKYDNKVDIYALGLIWVEMLSIFNTEDEQIEVLEALRDGIFPDNFAIKYPQEYDLLQEMVAEDPILRPTATAVMNRHLVMYPYLTQEPSIKVLLDRMTA